MLIPKLVTRGGVPNRRTTFPAFKFISFDLSKSSPQHFFSTLAFSITFQKYQTVNNILLPSTGFQQKMSYFVIGVSGVTCGGKTTMSKLLQRSFPYQSRIIHQDKYFYPDDYEGHVRLPEVENHVNYDSMEALDMKKMHQDVLSILESSLSSPEIYSNGNSHVHNGDSTIPHFSEGIEFLSTVEDIGIDTSEYSRIPILIIEGFTMFASDILYNKCDVRFFLTLDEETCRYRRSLRNFDPPDCPGYFDKCIWPEYQQHYNKYIINRPEITVHSGKAPVYNIWKESVELILKKINQKFMNSNTVTTR